MTVPACTAIADAARASIDRERRSREFGANADPLVRLIPGEGGELAELGLIRAAEAVMGHTIPLHEFAPGKYARINVARVRQSLRRWAARQERV
jgi:hypothetical protein